METITLTLNTKDLAVLIANVEYMETWKYQDCASADSLKRALKQLRNKKVISEEERLKYTHRVSLGD